MRISVFGLGYVGAVTAACLAREGHEVYGVDVNPEKVDLINRGESPIIEPGLNELLRENVQTGAIRATTDFREAVQHSDVSLVSVGTPPKWNGEPDLSYVFNVCREIGLAIHAKNDSHLVVLRSTVPPGTLSKCRELLLRYPNDKLVFTAFNPEFLREGTAIRDFYEPPYTIIGTDDRRAEQMIKEMYASVKGPMLTVKPEVAEMVKYVANTWHSAKIGFANEIGRIAKAFGVDGREVMNIIVQDTKLNISPVYMRPGFAFGGSCLPKDLGSLLYHAQSMNVTVPMLNALRASNEIQIELAAQEILNTGVRNIAVFGLAFKSGTDDLRESPSIKLIKKLLGEGIRVKIYDRSVYQARLMGTNLAYIRKNLPHFEELLVATPRLALEETEMAVITYNDPEFSRVLSEAPDHFSVYDLAGIFNEPPRGVKYSGIAW
ncbi:MAG TPA: UDP-glucose/GDP-mannose dehydrogenase family protein [Bacilli bacterium]